MLYLIYFLCTVLIVALDQCSKYLIVANIELHDSIEIIRGFFNITYVRNFGAGFSILQDARLFLIIVSSASAVFLTYLLFKTDKKDKLMIVSLLFLLGGSIGNVIDRIRLGYVVDFLDFIIFKYDFPVFNIADSFLTIGCGLLIISILTENKNA